MKKFLAIIIFLAALGARNSAGSAEFCIGVRHAGLGNLSGMGSMAGIWQIEIFIGPLRVAPGWYVDNEGLIKMAPVTLGFQAKIPQKLISPFIGIDLTYYATAESSDDLFGKVMPQITGGSKEGLAGELISLGFGNSSAVVWGVEAKAGIEIALNKAVRFYTGMGYGYTMISSFISGNSTAFGLGNMTWEMGFRLCFVQGPAD